MTTKFVLKNLLHTNKKFDQITQEKLGFSSEIQNSDWIIDLNEFDKIPDLFSDKKLIPIKKNSENSKEIFEQLISSDDFKLNAELIKKRSVPQSSNKNQDEFKSWFYDMKSPISFNEAMTTEADFKNLSERLHSEMKARFFVSYKKSMNEYSYLFQLIKFGYLTNSSESISVVEEALKKEAFGGIQISGYELGHYVDPFLICAPYLSSIPITRFSSSHFFVLERTLKPNISENLGISDIMINRSLPIIKQGSFDLFNLTSLQTRRYLDFLINKLNGFYKFQFHPKNFITSTGVNYKFMLQQVCTIFLTMTDFASLASNVNFVDRLYTSAAILDKLANYRFAYKMHILGEASDKNGDTKEFYRLLKVDFLKEVNEKIYFHLVQIDKELAKEFKASLSKEIKEFTDFSSNHKFDETLRIVRNLRHGTFINNDNFLKLFTAGSVKIPPSHITIIYALMLIMIIDPEWFLKN